MIVYHTTSRVVEILEGGGFRDYQCDPALGGEGVKVTDKVLCVEGDAALQIELPDEVFAQYEIHEGAPHREAIIPAAELNKHGKLV